MWKQIIIISIWCLVACSPSDRNALVMGTDATLPPFAYMEAGEIRGFDVELGQLLAQKLQKSIRINNMALPQLILALAGGKVDFAISALSVTAKRQQQFNFTDVYFHTAQFMIMRRDHQFSIDNAEALSNKRIGVKLASTGQAFAQNIKGAIAVPFDTVAVAVTELYKRKLDAVMVDRDIALKLARKDSDMIVMPIAFSPKEAYAIAVPKSNPQLLATLNTALRELQQDGSLEKLFTKYFQIAVK